jgi:ppGpp synthetase/RelA/SpoT-type nucleotidyltranferase
MDHETIKQKATALTTSLQGMLASIPVDIDKGTRLYSRGEWHFQLAEARAAVRATLSTVFGAEEKAGVPDSRGKSSPVDCGLWTDLLTADAPDYAQSVLFAYYSVDGSDPFHVQDARNRSWRDRDNLFYKGRRWSNPVLKKHFYHYFKILRELVGIDRVPLRYWVTNSNQPHLLITPSVANSDVATPGILPMPYYKDGNGIPGRHSCALKAYFKTLWKLKEDTSKEKSAFDKAANRITLDSLRIAHEAAWEDACERHDKLLDNWVQRFRAAGINRKWGNDAKIIRREVFDVVALYQYHDTPYVINLFQPATSDRKRFREYPELTERPSVRNGRDDGSRKKRAWTWLAITHEEGRRLDQAAQSAAAELANALGYLYVIEERVTDNYKEEIGYQLKYERWYHGVREKYDTLGAVAANTLSALCRKAKLPTQPVLWRVKACNSLFEKVAKRANGREEDVDQADRVKLLRAIRDEKHDELPRQIHDLVGVRVVFAFDADLQVIIDLLEKEIGAGRLRKVRPAKDLREWTEVKTELGMRAVFDYRSVHYWVTLSGDRVKMPETEPLKDLTCEIQLRSVLAHGWADAAHDVYYKSDIPEEVLRASAQAKKVREILQGCAQALKKQDEDLSQARDLFSEVVLLHGVEEAHDAG